MRSILFLPTPACNKITGKKKGDTDTAIMAYTICGFSRIFTVVTSAYV